MTWWLIALLFLAAFGPVFWLIPGRRERQLAAMRQRARTLGMQVELCHLPELNPKPEDRVTAGGERTETVIRCVAYRLPYGRKLDHVPVWRLQRDARSGNGMFAGWCEQIQGSASQDYWAELGEILPGLPPDCIAIECDRHQVSCYWRERTDPDNALMTVNRIAENLEKIKKLQLITEQIEDNSNTLAE